MLAYLMPLTPRFRAYRQVRRIKNMGCHEGRQRLQHTCSSLTLDVVLTSWAEFSGTLMGFDDYVSKWTPQSIIHPQPENL